jgi:hypothetical protein
MFIKNYTSEVPVAQTIHRIQQVLVKCGVSGITTEYGPNADITAIKFHIKVDPKMPEITIRLPADREAAQQALWLDYVDGDRLSDDGTRLEWNPRKKKTKADFLVQAERTAWKLVQDWIEVQMSLIQMRQAETLQVFLPYVWNGKETIYDKIKAGGYQALLPERTE